MPSKGVTMGIGKPGVTMRNGLDATKKEHKYKPIMLGGFAGKAQKAIIKHKKELESY